MIMRLLLDDLVCFPDLVVDIWEDQIAHSVLSQAAPTMTTISALPQSCLLNRCPRPWCPRPRFSSRKTRANTARKHGGIPGSLPRLTHLFSDLRIQPSPNPCCYTRHGRFCTVVLISDPIRDLGQRAGIPF